METTEMKVAGGVWVLLDRDDWEWAVKHNWCFDDKGYTKRNNWVEGKNKTIKLHREIMARAGYDIEGVKVDHKNQNPLDNRKCNLRIATHRQNQRNCKKRSHNTSGYKCVSFNKNAGKYSASIKLETGSHHLGLYEDPVYAAKVYDQAAIYFYGEFASLNFPEEDYSQPKYYDPSKDKRLSGSLNTKSGLKGVTWIKKLEKWQARITLNGKRKSLGYFPTKEEAHQAYLSAKECNS